MMQLFEKNFLSFRLIIVLYRLFPLKYPGKDDILLI